MIVHCTVDYLPKQFLPQNVWKEAKPAGKLARPRKKWSKDVRKIHGHVVKIRVYCWLRSLHKRYHILNSSNNSNPSFKLMIQMRGKISSDYWVQVLLALVSRHDDISHWSGQHWILIFSPKERENWIKMSYIGVQFYHR